MFLQQTNIPQQTTKIYLRLKNKKSFPLLLKHSTTPQQLHQLILKKTQIPSHDLIVMHQGQQLDFPNHPQPISFKNNAILHIINKKFLRNDILSISLKFILNNLQKSCLGQTTLFAKCSDSIKNFIRSKVLQVIQERTNSKIHEDDLSLVSNGTTLKKQLSFHDYLIEDGSEIVCMINYSQVLQKSVNNVSTHKIFTSNHQKNLEAKQQSRSYQDPKNLFLEPSSYKKKSEVQKKLSLTLSQQKSEEFIKLNTFESKNQIFEKERLLNEALQTEKHSNKLKKKLKITSDLARKFENEIYQDNVQENYKLPQNDREEEQNVPQILKQEPDSPIDVEYPQIQRRGKSLVCWDPITDQKNYQATSKKEDISQYEAKEINQQLQILESQKNDHQSTFKEQDPKIQEVKITDMILYGKSSQNHLNLKDRIEELSKKIKNLFDKERQQEQKQRVPIDLTTIEKKGQISLGDFLIPNLLIKPRQGIIKDVLVNKFKEAISKINIKKAEDYGDEQKQQQKPEKPQKQQQEQREKQKTPEKFFSTQQQGHPTSDAA